MKKKGFERKPVSHSAQKTFFGDNVAARLAPKKILRTMWHIISSKKMILPQSSLSVAPNRFLGPTDKLT
jgi:hypothetical protein